MFTAFLPRVVLIVGDFYLLVLLLMFFEDLQFVFQAGLDACRVDPVKFVFKRVQHLYG